jgi:DNA-binding MurR/RpiR family transcriptional regulator
LAKEIGLKGFTDLKIRLAAESIPDERRIHEDITSGDQPAEILEKVLRTTASAMEEAAGTVDREQFTRAVELLGDAAHVLCAGVGNASHQRS